MDNHLIAKTTLKILNSKDLDITSDEMPWEYKNDMSVSDIVKQKSSQEKVKEKSQEKERKTWLCLLYGHLSTTI